MMSVAIFFPQLCVTLALDLCCVIGPGIEFYSTDLQCHVGSNISLTLSFNLGH